MKKVLSLILAACMLLACVSAFAEDAAPTYTYNRAINAKSFPTNWNPFQYQTSNDNDEALSRLSDSFFDFDYNEDMDGYAMKPSMVIGDPVDVTADYVGDEWGIPADATGRAWKYTLRDDLKWEDGTPINAQTIFDSMELLLDPKAQNYRADSYYGGSVVIHNAEAYAKQGTNADTSIRALMAICGEEDVESFLAHHGEEKGYIDWKNSYGDTYSFETKTWSGSAASGVVETPLTIKELYDFYVVGAGAEYCTWADEATKADWALDELFVKYTYPELAFDTVGVKVVGDLDVVFILDKALSGFQLKYNLSPSLVHKELYEKCGTYEDGVYTNNYGTSLETTISYGPWKMVEFQSDKVIAFEKNENWYGFSVPENEGLYQTTRIETLAVSEIATRVAMFLSGELDIVGLDKDYMPQYATSEYTYYDEGASVFAMAFNPRLSALETNQKAGTNKTILTLKEFRMAMSLGIDRAAFCLATAPTNAPAFALYGNTIIGDPEAGTFYRNEEAAKQVIVDFWGLSDEVGEGKIYATLDDAIDSITGYNLAMAREYFNTAYDKAIAEGLMTETDVVEIIIGTPDETTAFYNAGYEFLVNNYTEAVKGTKLEGKLTFTRDATLGNGYGNALRNNQVDMLFGVGWNGSEFDPYNLMEAYVSSSYQYDPAWDSTTSQVEVTLDGVTYTASAYAWYECMNGTTIKATKVGTTETEELCFPYSDDAEIAAQRVLILAALENAVLQNYDFIPLMNNAGAHLKGMQISYPTEEEVYPMSYGGIKYMTYEYTDAEWEAYVAQQGGTLNYK